MARPCLSSGSPLAAGLLAALVAAPLAASASAVAPPIPKRQGVLAQQMGAIQTAVAASLAATAAPITTATAAGAPVSGTAAPSAARVSADAPTGRLLLVRTERRLPVSGDPVWELQLDLPGQPRRTYEALVGRASRQLADRQRLGSRAPLPQGRYRLSPATPVQAGDDGELGQFVWIGLEPEFPTARRGLGIHHDPSAGWGRQSGTDGCIGLIHGNDLLGLAALLERSGTRELLVRD